MSVSIGVIYAICDHFEMNNQGPVLASTLKQSSGVSRSQLRQWVRQGRLNEYEITMSGTMQKAYSRPKQKEDVI